ncbi:MAG: hypothetical protein GXP39_18865 [Chloroflexi bacterium]|nr:hypothetical protein [Chloroflexota bacterium]
MKKSLWIPTVAVVLVGAMVLAGLIACAPVAPNLIATPIPPTPVPAISFTLHQEGYGDMGSLPATRGIWSADGLVQDSGAASDITFITGDWGNFQWDTVHGTVLLASETDAQSSISLKVDSDFTNLNIDEDGVWHFEAEGNFVILSGTGNYANLRGEGTVKTAGTVEFLEPDRCPIPEASFCPVLKVVNEYEGKGRFD